MSSLRVRAKKLHNLLRRRDLSESDEFLSVGHGEWSLTALQQDGSSNSVYEYNRLISRHSKT